MLTLIAESKTMTTSEHTVSNESFLKHCPVFEKYAEEIIEYLSTLDNEELSRRISISNTLATKASRLIYEFPNKSKGNEASPSFTGEVFRGIDISTLSTQDLEFADKHVMLISSLYGVLSPQDIIKPYRLDFNAECSPTGGKLSTYWKPKITSYLIKLIKESSETEIVDLLPGEAAKCIDWSLIKEYAQVQKPEFKIVTDSGDLKTPHSGKLKELRGKMVRAILSDKINDFKTLLSLKTAEFAADDEIHKSGLPIFISLK